MAVASASPPGPAGREAGGGEAGLEIGVAEPLQVVAHRAQRADGRQAGLGVAAVLLEVLGDQGLQQRAAGVVERPAIDQELGQGPGLVGDPGGEGGQEVVAADEVVLQGQDAEEEVAPGVRLRSAPPARGPRRSSRRRRRGRSWRAPGTGPGTPGPLAARRAGGAAPAPAPPARPAAPARSASSASAR